MYLMTVFKRDPVGQQYGVAVPPNRRLVAASVYCEKTCFTFDKLGRQCGRPSSKSLIGFLQDHNVGVQTGNNFGRPVRIAAAVQPDTFADVPRCNGEVAHKGPFAFRAISTIVLRMRFNDTPYLTLIICGILLTATIISFFTAHWTNVFVSVTALLLIALPTAFSKRFHIKLPLGFAAAISAFVFATLFLGEVFDFYERFWWWDVLLHGTSAVGFGIIGFLFVLFLFEGDKYAAPPWALGLIAFCFAVSIGVIWEIFEFAADKTLGLNMQKSGLSDTMGDLIVDCVGALVGASAGFFWLKGRNTTLSGLINEFVELNREGFRKIRNRLPRE